MKQAANIFFSLFFCGLAVMANGQTLLQKIPVAFAPGTQARLFTNDSATKHVLVAYQPSRKLLTCIELGNEFTLMRPVAAELSFGVAGITVLDAVIGQDSMWVYLSTLSPKKADVFLLLVVGFDLKKSAAGAVALNPSMGISEFLAGHTRGDVFWALGIAERSSTIRLYGYRGANKVAEERIDLSSWAAAAKSPNLPPGVGLQMMLQPEWGGALRENVNLCVQLHDWDAPGSLNETTVPFQIFVQPARWVFAWNDFRDGTTRLATLDAKLFLSNTATLPAPALNKKANSFTQFHATVWQDKLIQVASSGNRLVMGVYDFVRDTIMAVHNYTPGVTTWPFARQPIVETREEIGGATYFARGQNDWFFAQARDTLKNHEAFISRVYKAGLSLAAFRAENGTVSLRLGYFKDQRNQASPFGLGLGPITVNIPTGPPALFGYTTCQMDAATYAPAQLDLTTTARIKAQQFYSGLLRGRGQAEAGYPVALGYKPDIAFHFPMRDGRYTLGFYDKRDKQLYVLAFR